jgi:2-C-methyl-D-erythritol 4-phosphate cytidylyltransferase
MAVALIVAAGSGERLGAERPKALVELGGRAMLEWSLETLLGVAAIERIVIALPSEVLGGDGDGVPHYVGTPRTAAHATDVAAVPGGATRSESVRRALGAAGKGDPVLVHDAARPLITGGLAVAVLAALEDERLEGAVAATPVTDTIKRAGVDRVVQETLPRAALWAVQTPQVFRRDALERALEVPDEVLAEATDDAWLVERAGGKVAVVPAPRENIKVTTGLDLLLAEALITRSG